MSFRSKRELLAQVAPRYQLAGHTQKSVILDEFVAATGYARKYAIHLLTQPPMPAPAQIRRPRAPQYGSAVQAALETAWSAANCIGTKRLVPFLPKLVAALERHGHLTLTDDVRTQLLAMSRATADRLLQRARAAGQPRGVSTTKAGSLLKRQIPVRTFADWDDAAPGFFEADLVAHCGPRPDGAFLATLVLTDVATGWVECQALLYRSQDQVLQALKRARQLIPFPLLGFDTDNGAEFIADHTVQRIYESAQTPFERLSLAAILTADRQAQLDGIFATLDPVRLLAQIGQLQDAFWQHARVGSADGVGPGSEPPMRFSADSHGERDPTASLDGPAAAVVHQKRAYHRKHVRIPRWWRTRMDPFAEVWAEIEQWLEANPTRTAKSIFTELQQRDPDRYPTAQLRTLQRRIAKWRTTMITTFDDQWIQEEILADTSRPRPLRAVTMPDEVPVPPAA